MIPPKGHILNLKKLEIFYNVAKYGSLTKAAERLSITQPAVSIQIRDLEKYYNVKLFKRSGKNLYFTKTGQLLYSYAEKIFQLREVAENELLRLSGHQRKTLRIGTTQTCAKYILAPAISNFQSTDIEIKISVNVDTPDRIIESINHAENEIAIVPYDEEYGHKLESIPFQHEEIFLVVSDKHKWFGRRKDVVIKEIEEERIVFPARGSSISKAVLEVFQKHHIEPKEDLYYEGGGLEFIKEIISKVEAVSFLTLLPIKDELNKKTLRVLSLSSNKIYMDLRIYYNDMDSLSSLARDFIDHLLKTQSELSCGKKRRIYS